MWPFASARIDREGAIADLAQLHVGGIGPVGEVGIAVAELLRQIEDAALGNLAGALCRLARQPLEHLRRRDEDALVIAAALAVAALERGAVLDRDERVLQLGAALVVRVHVAGGDGRHAERLCELVQRVVAPRIASLVGTLQLDVERAGKRAREPRRRVRVDDAEPLPRTAGQRNEPLGMLGEDVDARPGRQQLALPAGQPGARVRVGEDAAEVRVAHLRLAEQRDMGVADRDLGAGDRADAEVLRGVCELERAVDAVVVGERQRLVAELGRARRELLRQ